MSPTPLLTVLAGQPVPFARGESSAIAKAPTRGPVQITTLGLTGDAHGDLVHHGGPDKAIHHFPFDHYTAFASMHPGRPGLFDRPGLFGENLSTTGLTERDVHLGDVFAVGSCRLQISQPRQPCWKIDTHLRIDGFSRGMQDTGRTGWYWRVIEEGALEAGDALRLLDRPSPEWSIYRILQVYFVDTLNRDALAGLAGLALLPAGWRANAQRRLDTGIVEDWAPRLLGP